MTTYLPRREVARRLGQHQQYANGAIDALKIPSVRIGKALCIDERDFAKLKHLGRRQIVPGAAAS